MATKRGRKRVTGTEESDEEGTERVSSPKRIGCYTGVKCLQTKIGEKVKMLRRAMNSYKEISCNADGGGEEEDDDEEKCVFLILTPLLTISCG